MYNWAISRDIVENNPCHMVEAPAKEAQRDRVLSTDKIRSIWFGLDSAKMSLTIRLAIKFQLATAQRKGEVIAAVWSEFDLEEGMWTIPSEKFKNDMAHRVPKSGRSSHLVS